MWITVYILLTLSVACLVGGGMYQVGWVDGHEYGHQMGLRQAKEECEQ